VVAALPVGAGLGHRPQRRGGEVAELAVLDGGVQRLADRRGDAEVHLGDEGADAVGERAPLQPAMRAQLFEGDRIECRGVQAIAPPCAPAFSHPPCMRGVAAVPAPRRAVL
jgi:hypothetical protein